MNRKLIVYILGFCVLLWMTQTSFAAGNAPGGGPSHGLDPTVLLGVAIIWIIAKVCGELFERFGQPAVLGELCGGILLGNLVIFGLTFAEPLKTNEVIAALAELGVIILLFEVGLESNLGEMLEVGWSSLFVAAIGVIAPFFLGWWVAAYFVPDENRLAHIFIGATLCATSVGITARVLKDMRKLGTREARIVLGAAVIDDVLGLLILAVVAGAISASATGTAVSLTGIVWIAGKAILFLVAALGIGHYVVPRLLVGIGRFRSRGVLLAVSLAFCFLLAWLAGKVGLAAIVGAFAAGLLLDEVHFERAGKHDKHDLEQLIVPVSSLLAPIFFVLMGLKVDLRAFGRIDLLGFATVLTLAAIIGKQLCSLGVAERGLNRIAIGFGMIPRGEVGLIFAGIGASLLVPNALGVETPVIGPNLFSVIVIMVIVTTLITPPALKWAMARKSVAPDDSAERLS
jgi:Kef-type K+ transport system membrane component KefB